MGLSPQQIENQRLNALKLYGVLDTLPEEEFDNITKLAAQVCNTPIALISLSDKDRQWFKSKVGFDACEADRQTSFCNQAMQGAGLLQIEDATQDPRFADNPNVIGPPFVRFYAGVPIINKDGYVLGTLCVVNYQPQSLTDSQKDALRTLASTVMSLFELRYKNQEAEFLKKALDYIAAVSVIDSNNNYVYANQKFCDIAELPQEEIVGKSYRDISLTDIDEDSRLKIIEAAQQGKIFTGRFRNKGKNENGEPTWSNTTVIPYLNANNEVVRVSALRVDVTTEMLMLEKLEEAERVAGIGSWQYNVTTGVRYWSKGMYAIMGYDKMPEAAPSVFDYIVPEDKAKLEATVNATLRGEAPVTLEVRIITSDNKVRCVLVNSSVTRNNKGEVLILSGTVQDITERKETEAKYKSLVEETSQMTFITDVEGRYTYASPRLKKVIGYDDEDIIGTQFSFIYDEDWRRKTIKFYIQQLTDKKEETTFIFPIKTKDGVKIWFQQIATLIKENDEVTGFRCVLHDITDRVKTEEAMREAARLATEAKEMQQSFLGKMSHEIRTPMNGVVGMVNLLQNTPLNDKQRVFVESIRESSVNLLRIINDILDVSKIEAGKMTFEETDFNLAKLVNNVVLTLRPAAEEKKLVLASYIDTKIPDTIIADPLRLNQVLLNLVGNALKFTERGSIVINVSMIQVDAEHLTLQFQVADTGIGIPENKLGSIFESFTQADTFTTRKYGGTGLGLTIARQLIEQQGGTIGVESELGRGTTFTFTYHCKIDGTMQHQPGSVAKSDGLPLLDGFNILLVEDNIINQMVAQHTIESWGAHVTIAGRANTAIELLKKNSFDLVLMDIQMPEMNGIQATKIIREELGINIPIIAMTASAMKGEKEGCLASGMNDYFSKPFEHSDLNRMLHKHLDVEKPREKLFDIEAFMELVGHDTDFAKHLVNMFAANTPAVLQQLKTKCEEKRYTELYTDVHNLKGTIGFFGKKELDDLLATIEKDLTAGNYSAQVLSDIRVLDRKLNQLIGEALVEMETLQG